MKKRDILTVALILAATSSLIYGVNESSRANELFNDTIELNETIEQHQFDLGLLRDNISELSQVNKEQEQEIVDLKTELKDRLKELEEARRRIAKINAKVSFDHMDALKVSGATEVHMRRALKGTALECVADDFALAEEKYGVNAFLIAAIAAWESGWGTSERATTQNNLTGHAVYNSQARGSRFSNWSDSIMNTTELLKNEYLTPGGESFNGYGVEHINQRYCFKEDGKTVDYDWCRGVISIAYDLKNKANNF